jgi:hypothetical protein
MDSTIKKFDQDERFLQWEAIQAAFKGLPLKDILLKNIFGFFPEDLHRVAGSMVKKFALGRFQMIVTLHPKEFETGVKKDER